MDAARKDLPADYAIDALVLEVDRRRKLRGGKYSYGDLIAETTPEEREKIVRVYRSRKARGGRGGSERFDDMDEDQMIKAVKRRLGAEE